MSVYECVCLLFLVLVAIAIAIATARAGVLFGYLCSPFALARTRSVAAAASRVRIRCVFPRISIRCKSFADPSSLKLLDANAIY